MNLFLIMLIIQYRTLHQRRSTKDSRPTGSPMNGKTMRHMEVRREPLMQPWKDMSQSNVLWTHNSTCIRTVKAFLKICPSTMNNGWSTSSVIQIPQTRSTNTSKAKSRNSLTSGLMRWSLRTNRDSQLQWDLIKDQVWLNQVHHIQEDLQERQSSKVNRPLEIIHNQSIHLNLLHPRRNQPRNKFKQSNLKDSLIKRRQSMNTQRESSRKMKSSSGTSFMQERLSRRSRRHGLNPKTTSNMH